MAKTSKKRISKVEKALHKFGADSIEKLAMIADDDLTPQKLRADIWKWFAEMEFGKPTSKQTACGDNTEDLEIVLDGDLEEWSK
ncbi:MAG: hypothetical protein E7675_00335 [Ruminococcaceae bacterium]|nr:hypothetical protein [Oscillospiraceae bacterium]